MPGSLPESSDTLGNVKMSSDKSRKDNLQGYFPWGLSYRSWNCAEEVGMQELQFER